VSQLLSTGGSEFHVAGAVQLNGRLPMSVCLNKTTKNGMVNDRMFAAIDKSHQSISA